MISQTYRILEENLFRLEKLVEKQNRRANKLGLPSILLEVGAQEAVPNEDGLTVDYFRPVTVTGQSPRLNGYEFVATLQHTEEGNVIRTVPTWEERLPAEFRESDPSRCDHCKQYRRRNDTFVVYHADHKYLQVGRQCLADFVGSERVHALAAQAEMYSLISEAAGSMGERFGGGLGEHFLLEESIAYAAEAVLRAGWCSRAKAESLQRTATADIALGAMRSVGERCTWKCSLPCLNHFTPSEEAVKLTKDVLAWAPGFIERELGRSESDYLWNLKVVLANDVIPARSFGLAASVLGAYQRDLDRQEKIRREAAASTSEYVGTVGERIRLTLITRAFRFIDTEWGASTLITYHTPEGDVVKWFASGAHTVELDVEGDFEATVKEHREYQGVRETYINRVKPYISPEEKKSLAKARSAAKKEYERLLKISNDAWDNMACGAVGNTDTQEEANAKYVAAQAAASEAYKAWKSI